MKTNTRTTQQIDRRKARKFARAAKHAIFWRDAPDAVRDRPRTAGRPR